MTLGVESVVGAYRSMPKDVAPRADDVRWRVRVAATVQILIWLLLVGALANMLQRSFTPVQLGEFPVWLFSFLFLFLAILKAACAWVLTVRRPSAARWPLTLAWALRALATASAVLVVAQVAFRYPFLLLMDAVPPLAWLLTVISMCVAPAGLLYVGALFRELGLPQRAGSARNVTLVLLASYAINLFIKFQSSEPFRSGVATPVVALTGLVAAVCLLRGLLLVRELRQALRVASHAWWVDVNDVTNAQWASVVTTGLGLAEVMTPAGERVDFSTPFDAEQWLRKRGWAEGLEAIETSVVKRLPPPP